MPTPGQARICRPFIDLTLEATPPLPPPLPPLPARPPTPPALRTTASQRELLRQLEEEAQLLKANKADLESQLRAVGEQIEINDAHIHLAMRRLESQLFKEQRSARQPAFRDQIVSSDNVVEGLWKQMKQSPALKDAIHTIGTDRSSSAHDVQVSLALMKELAGETGPFLHQVAARVLEYDQNIGQRLRPGGLANAAAARTDAPEPAMSLFGPRAAFSPSASVKDEASTPGPLPGSTMGSPAPVSSDAAPIVLPHAVSPVPTSVSALSTMSSVTTANLENRARLQKTFPGLLEHVASPGQSFNPIPSMKRPRPAAESEPPNKANPAKPALKAASARKRVKLDKDPVTTPVFIAFIKHLAAMHQSGKPFVTEIQCGKCGQIKRDVRVLNCLHLYCHKCILQLRADGLKGDPVTGFRSFCLRQGCTAEVSGKTGVIDAEVMELLEWYDKQAADIAHGPVQLHVLNTALERNPDDDDIQLRLEIVQGRLHSLQARGEADMTCDLVEAAKLARKPY